MFPKPKRYENKEYRRFVSEQPCFDCGIEGFSQCCHRNGAGMGTKASDLETFPLCCTRNGMDGCHYSHDHCRGLTLEDRKCLEDHYVRKMQGIAKAEGRWPKDAPE